jgi:hypothetical protein
MHVWQSPHPRAQMFLRPVNKPASALLAKRMNETASNRLREYPVADIEALRGHDPQGKLTGIQRATGERFLAKVDCLATLEAAMNVNVGRNFFDVAGGFKDRDGRRYVGKI